MLRISVLHPQILAALGRAGHLSKVLITDGNYPHAQRVNPRATIVWANFTPGVLDANSVLNMVCQLVPVEEVHVMQPAKSGLYTMKNDPPIWKDFRKTLKSVANFTEPLIEVQKPEFNALAMSEDLCLVIASAETQIYANVMVTIGVVK